MIGSAVFFALLHQGEVAKDVYKKVLPSVVTINTDDGLGSGFVVKSEGIVVTCAHVINGAKTVSVTFSDGSKYESTGLIDRDDVNDVAAIKVRFTDRPAVTYASGTVEVGENVFLVGAPLGLEFSISQGIVGQLRNDNGAKLIQHSAPSSSGNSGGPLFNSKAEVIGVHTSGIKAGQGLNFATPIASAKGLDLTLATRRWADVVPPKQPKKEEETSKSEEISDAEVARIATSIWEVLQEAYRARDLSQEIMIEVTTKSPGNAIMTEEVLDAPKRLGDCAARLEAESKLVEGSKLEAELVDTCTGILNSAVAYFDVIKNVRSAQRDGWTPSVETTFDQNFAKIGKPYVSEELAKFLNAALPKKAQTQDFVYRFDPDHNKMVSDLYSRFGAALRLESLPYLSLGAVYKDSLAKKLGFESGDVIMSIEDKKGEEIIPALLSCLKDKGSTHVVEIRKHTGGSRKLKMKVPN